VYGGVFDRHPEAQLVIGHLGEMFPFFAWRIQRAFEYNPYSQRTRKLLQDYLSDNIWLTTSGNFNDRALITAPLAVGADHIMFASNRFGTPLTGRSFTYSKNLFRYLPTRFPK
jgi:predicted TIM-barrel fold metal-dependent hydrolase